MSGEVERGPEMAGAPWHRGRSHWWNTSAKYRPTEPLDSDIAVDCCVIGAGVTGLSTAYHLKKLDPGLSVAVLETEVAGYGASGRNAGQLIVQFGGGGWRRDLKRYGPESMGAAWAYTHDGISLIEQLLFEEGIDCDYEPTGYLKTSLRVDGEASFDRYVEFLDKIGQLPHYEYLAATQVEQDFPSPYLGAAVYDRRGGQFNPLKLVRGLKAAAERRGVVVFEQTQVIEIHTRPGDILVHSNMGSVRCQKVVLATNAYSHLLPGAENIGMAREQRPLMVKATISEPLSESAWQALAWKRRCGVNVVSDLFYSFAPTRDGRLLYVGGYYADAPTDRALIPEAQWRLKAEGPEHLAAFFPALGPVKTAQTWGGPISITADWIPHVGRTRDPRITYACGCWGNGMALGMHNGLTLAELTLDRTGGNTDLWFVERDKVAWPNRLVTEMVARGVVATRRKRGRKIGAAMNPPIRFQT